MKLKQFSLTHEKLRQNAFVLKAKKNLPDVA